MGTREAIEQYQKKMGPDIPEFVVQGGDALITSGKYMNIKLSDIFLFNPVWVKWIAKDTRMPNDLRIAARGIVNE